MKQNIVVLGAGFGGLKAAREIHRQLKKNSFLNDFKVLLVDKNEFHSFTPLWYEIATTSKQLADNLKLKSLVSYPLSELFRGTAVEVITDEVKRIDLTKRVIVLKKQSLNFEYLVLALGAETNYFEIPGLKENSIAFKKFDDTIAVRDAVWNLISERKGLPPTTDLKNLQILIGGGGSTGVELAGEIKSWVCELERKFKFSCGVQITVVERRPALLANFEKRVIKKVSERLSKLNIKTLTDETINKIIPGAAILENGKIIPFDVFIWTGGIKTPVLVQKLPLQFDEKARIKTNASLACLAKNEKQDFSEKIFAIGDISAAGPQVARVAISQADITAKNIIQKIKNRRPKNYKSKNYPYIIPVGGKFAVAKVGPFVVSGFPAWVLKGFVELNYLFSIMTVWRAFKIWTRGFSIFIKNDRLG